MPANQRTALLTIDMQNAFVHAGPAVVPGTAACIPEIASLVKLFRARDLPIVHAIRLYEPDGSNAEPFRRDFIRASGPVVAPGTEGANLVPELAADAPCPIEALYDAKPRSVGPLEWVMYKPRWDAFHATALEQHLRGIEVSTVIVCGCNFPNCPRATLFGASNRDFTAMLVRDATSQVTPDRLADIGLMGARVVTVAEVAALLG